MLTISYSKLIFFSMHADVVMKLKKIKQKLNSKISQIHNYFCLIALSDYLYKKKSHTVN